MTGQHMRHDFHAPLGGRGDPVTAIGSAQRPDDALFSASYQRRCLRSERERHIRLVREPSFDAGDGTLLSQITTGVIERLRHGTCRQQPRSERRHDVPARALDAALAELRRR